MAEMLPCPACGTENAADAVRCHVCDYELRSSLPGPPTGLAKCGRCGSAVAEGAAFCQVCGQSMDRRLARPHTGALNVRAMFGDDDNVPVRAPIREHTEIAPGASDFAPSFSPPGGQGQQRYSSPPPQQQQRLSSSPEPAAPRGRRRPAPRPRPDYSGFDAGDSGQGSKPGDGAPGPVYAQNPARPSAAPRPRGGRIEQDPGASSSNLPRPRVHHEAHAEPASGAIPRSGYAVQPAQAPSSSDNYGAAAPSWQAPPSSVPASLSGLRVVLVGRDGREGEAFPLPPAGIEVGRSGGIAFPSDPFVSPQHARITPIDGGVHLADLSSRNGVYLRVTEPTPVYPGDHFLLGNQLLRLDRLEAGWQEQPLDANQVRGFGTPAKPPWALLTRVCVGDIEDDRYHLRGTEMTIGREQGEIVFPSDGFLSRAHARVRMQVQDNAMLVMLEDLGSANGTYLRIRGAVNVPYGTMFRVGDQIFRVRHD